MCVCVCVCVCIVLCMYRAVFIRGNAVCGTHASVSSLVLYRQMACKKIFRYFSCKRDRDREWRSERCVTGRLITETNLL